MSGVASRVGAFVILLLALWFLGFVLTAFTASGKDFYEALASIFFGDSDAAIPVMNLGIPILLIGTLATVLMFQNEKKSATPTSALPAPLPGWMHRQYHRWRAGKGDLDCRRFTIYCVVLPLIILTVGDIHRNLFGEQLSLDDQLMEVGNAFGFAALVALSYFLIPVAKQSPILIFFQINPVAAVTVHIWSGRIVIFGVAIHGLFHAYRWKALAGESILNMIFPPLPCWSPSGENDFSPECVDDDTDCECYDLLRNFTGIVGIVLLTVIGITSLNYVRRTNYRLFYLTHVVAGPLAILTAIIHWRKSMAYIAPSFLYYIATSFPVRTENQTCLKQDGGIKLTRVERIQSSHAGRPRQCVSLTIKATPAAVTQFCSGQYVKLSAPQVSSAISHPFTINRVPGSEDELRIIFRVMGRFTNKLCHLLTKPVNGALPRIMVDGFYGAQNRLEQLFRHDVAVMVAGGIGITPYLSLVEDAYNTLASTDSSVTKDIVVHWICREQELIDYVLKEYFEPLVAKADAYGFKIRIVVHKTQSSSNYDDKVTEDAESPKHAQAVQSHGGPFCPTLYSAGSSCSTIHILVATLTFGTISWVGLSAVLAIYNHNHAKKEILYRFISPAFVLCLGFVVSWLAKCIVSVQGRREAMSLRLHDGVVFSRVPNDASSMEDVLGHHDVLLQEVRQSDKSSSAAVTYDEREGRPTMHSLLKQLETARCPGLFMCGPKTLISELKDAAVERGSIRRCQCISDEPSIALYEELFEM